MEKFKEFFEKRIVKIVESVVMALSAAGLIIGGVKVEDISKIPALTSGILLAIETLITFIQALTTKKAVEEKTTVEEEKK